MGPPNEPTEPAPRPRSVTDQLIIDLCQPLGFVYPPPTVSEIVSSLLIVVFVCAGLGTFYYLISTPEYTAQVERRNQERNTRLANDLRDKAAAALPPGATEITPVRVDFPRGWLTFVRVENGKPTKYLVCYQHDARGSELVLSVARAD